jgi:hypothetical protein
MWFNERRVIMICVKGSRTLLYKLLNSSYCVNKFIYPMLYSHLLAVPKGSYTIYFLFHIPGELFVFPGKCDRSDFAS